MLNVREMISGSGSISDFWWLPKNVAGENLLIVLGHHHPLTAEDEPLKVQWFHSLDPQGRISYEIKHYGLGFLSQWQSVCENTNVYRTLKLFDHNREEAIFLGPFLIDIDNSESDNGYREDLNDAQFVTKQVVTHLMQQLGISSDDLRIFFSGRKGFNVEVRPEAIQINGSVPDQIRLSSSKLADIITTIRFNNNNRDSTRNVVGARGTVIDQIYGDRFGCQLKHPYIRLHHSINKWIRGDGKAIARRRIEIKYEQLREKSAAEICLESERLAQIP